MLPLILIGANGKMSKMLQSICQEKKLSFKIYSAKNPAASEVKDFRVSSGVIDFSLPEALKDICEKVLDAKVPYICGTTGWKSDEADKLFEKLGQEVAVVRDSNFSLGVEVFCQIAELLTQSVSSDYKITDIHHIHKRDSPSGTALKIRDRILAADMNAEIKIESIREGEVFGEHRLLASFQDQTLEFIHCANSRRPFAEGAIEALFWARKQKPGLYSMKNVLQGNKK